MSWTTPAEQARAITNASPSPQHWGELQGVLMQIAWNGGPVDRIVHDLDARLEAWPLEMRAVSLADDELPPERHWHWQLPSGADRAPWLRLVRHVEAHLAEIVGLPAKWDDVLRATRSLRVLDALIDVDRAIHAVSRFSTIWRLNLSHATIAHANTPTMGDLFDSLHERGTIELNLSATNLAPDDLRTLAEHRLGRALDTLQMSSLAARHDPGFIAAELARLLAEGALARLAVGYNGLGDQGGAVILGAPGAERLRALDLAGNGIGDLTCETLANRGEALNLECLDISGAALADRALTALASGRGLTDEAGLVLLDSRLTGRSLARLLDGELSEKLVLLDLSGNRLTDSSVPVLVSAALPRLRVLRLYVNGFSRAGIRTLEGWAAKRGIDIATQRPS